MKVAVTLRAWVMDTVQVPVPEQSPVQPAKRHPFAGVAVSRTLALDLYECVHVRPQLIPAGVETTLPLPDLATPRLI